MSPSILHQKKENGATYAYLIYHLKTEVSITLCCQLCSTSYTAVWIKNCSKSSSEILVATMKYTNNSHYERSHYMLPLKSTLFTVGKDEWDAKEDNSKSIKNALYTIVVHQKAPLGLKRCWTVKKSSLWP